MDCALPLMPSSATIRTTRGLELVAHPELHGRRHGAGPQRGEAQEVRRSPIAERIVEVRAVGHVEDVGEEIDRAARGTRPITETHIDLEESRARRAVALALGVRRVRIASRA